jgi:hypothetical protein
VIRVTPRAEREEFINAGIILFCRTRRFLAAAIELEASRLWALAPEIDVAMVQEQLDLIPRICAGEGPIGQQGRAEAFHWLVAPHNTVIQCSPVHCGVTENPAAALEELMEKLVRR